jgi:hypothetical protein
MILKMRSIPYFMVFISSRNFVMCRKSFQGCLISFDEDKFEFAKFRKNPDLLPPK